MPSTIVEMTNAAGIEAAKHFIVDEVNGDIWCSCGYSVLGTLYVNHVGSAILEAAGITIETTGTPLPEGIAQKKRLVSEWEVVGVVDYY